MVTQVWGSKKAHILSIMKANEGKPDIEVCQLIAEGLGYTLARAKRSFKHYGMPEHAKDRGVKVAKTKEVKGKTQIEKLLAGTEKLTKRGNDAIKEKNLNLMKFVGGNLGKPKHDASTADMKRLKEMADFEAALEAEDARSFVPKFLHKELGLV